MAGWSGGTFSRARNWVTDKNGAINPQAALFDQEDDNFAAGLNNCVTKDGLNKPSAAMDWNTQNLTNVGSLGAAAFVLAGINQFTSQNALKTGDTARASTTVFASDADLTMSLVAATYDIEAILFFTGTTTSGQGYKAQLNFSSTVTAAKGMTLYQQAGSLFAASSSLSGANLSIIASATVFTAGAGIDGVLCKGTFILTATNTVAVQWAQNSSSVNATNLLAMSRLTARRIV